MKCIIPLSLFSTVLLFLISACGILGGGSTSNQAEFVPNYVEYFELGKLEYDNGNLDEAIENLQQSIKLNPDFTPAAEMLGFALIDKNDFEAAMYHFAGILRQNAYSTNARLGKARIHLLEKNFDQALSDYNIALEADPMNADAHFYRGLVLQQMDERFLSYTSFARAVNTDDSFRETVAGLISITDPYTANILRREYLDIERKTSINRADLAALIVSIIRSDQAYFVKSGSGFLPPRSTENVGYSMTISDVPNNYWAETAIRKAIGAGLLELDSDNYFHSDRLVTKMDLAILLQTIVARIDDDPSITTRFIGEQSPFSDLNSAHWAYNAVRLSTVNGSMFPRQDNIFGLDDLVSGISAIYSLEKIRKIIDRK